MLSGEGAGAVFPPATFKLKPCVEVSTVFEESVTCTVKEAVPLCVGMPAIIPPEVKLNPAGSEPAFTRHV